jgi:two-component system chemotaxis sensor kinase CheA
MNQLDFEKLFGTFIEESTEQIETLEQDILNLEKDSGDEKALEEVFRMAHSLKGSTALMGFEKMTKLNHALEDMLQKVRDKEFAINTDVIDLLFKSLDMLKLMKDSISGQKEANDIDPQPLIANIKKLIEDSMKGSKTEVNNKVYNDYELKISQSDKIIIDDAITRGQQVYIIKIDIEEDAIMKAIKSFLIVNNVRGISQILRVGPENYESLSDADFGHILTLLIISSEDKDIVREQIEIVNEIKSIDITNYTDIITSGKDSDKGIELKISSNLKDNTDFRQEKRSTIRVDIRKLDKLMSLAGELVIDKERLMQLSTRLREKYNGDKDVQDLLIAMSHLDSIGDEIQESIMSVRMYTVENIFDRFPRMIRDLAHRSGKEINFISEGKETELDRSIIEEIVDPIVHLLRNAVDHGIESKQERIAKGKDPIGKIVLRARQEENNVVIEVIDDGNGIDLEAVKKKALEKGLTTKERLKNLRESDVMDFLFMPGFSTSQIISEVSGRGVGMDVVKTNIEKLNGLIDISTEEGIGTKVVLKLPLTLAIIQALLIKQGSNKFAVPLTSVIETIRLTNEDIKELVKHVKDREMFLWRDAVIPVVRLDKFFDIPAQHETDKYFAVVVAFSEKRLCLIVDKLIGEQQIVIKSLGEYLGKNKIFGDIKGISGTTILGDGSFAVILDIAGVLRETKNHK